MSNSKAVDGIDWQMLAAQKLHLLKVITHLEDVCQKESADGLTGILHLIDALQDEHGPLRKGSKY